ncbi:chemotaxis protein MotB [Oikeobacillus pervagus]|uniref:Chemotaxis protein MotB n=1 Tax=Oikeobacillus pervagus TaxID=1325931 RepID=A0AAJ1WKM9_9BACI|nr:flagellar motor protein MotB [Oikeobacillus pervagus]MDQ0216778.1 chemotaxis protein MotB [Oikeobacillus pervagus]
MAKRRKKKRDNGHMGEDWLLPYADLLTLLLALFIVLFAMSSVDAQKFQALSAVFNQTFQGGTGVLDEPLLHNLPRTKKRKDQESQDQKELKEVQTKISSYIQEKNLESKIGTSLTSEGLLLTIRDNVLFDSGEAEVRIQDIEIAKEISSLLEMDPPRSIIISGHTDNQPINTSQFNSNWELSAMRAVNFMKIVLQNEKLDPRLFSAKGYGEYQPVSQNDTSEGRAQNRRVEVLIMENHTQYESEKAK